MPEISRDILTRCVCEALEVTAFVIAEPLEAAPPAPAEPLTRTLVDFTGPVTGTLELICADSLAATLQQNLGIEPATDCSGPMPSPINELANIVCGMVLRSTFGTDGTGEVGLPHTEPIVEPLDPTPADACAFDAEGSLVIARITRRAA